MESGASSPTFILKLGLRWLEWGCPPPPRPTHTRILQSDWAHPLPPAVFIGSDDIACRCIARGSTCR